MSCDVSHLTYVTIGYIWYMGHYSLRYHCMCSNWRDKTYLPTYSVQIENDFLPQGICTEISTCVVIFGSYACLPTYILIMPLNHPLVIIEQGVLVYHTCSNTIDLVFPVREIR